MSKSAAAALAVLYAAFFFAALAGFAAVAGA